MEGLSPDDNETKGILPRAMEYIFEAIQMADEDTEFSVKCSYFEIYNEKIQDLLDRIVIELLFSSEDKFRS